MATTTQNYVYTHDDAISTVDVAYDTRLNRDRAHKLYERTKRTRARIPQSRRKFETLRKREARLEKQVLRDEFWTEGLSWSQPLSYEDMNEDVGAQPDETDIEEDEVPFLHRVGRDVGAGVADSLSAFLDQRLTGLQAGCMAVTSLESETISSLFQQLTLTAVQWAIQPPRWSVVLIEIVKQVLVLIPNLTRDATLRIHSFFAELIASRRAQDPNAGNDMRTEAGPTGMSHESVIVTAASYGLGEYLVTRKLPDVRSLMKSAANLGRDLNGLKQGVTAIADLIRWVSDMIQERVLTILRYKWVSRDVNLRPEFKEFVRDVDALLSEPIERSVDPAGIREMTRLMSLYNEINQFFLEFPKRINGLTLATVKDAQRRLYERYTANLVKYSETYNALRPCPFVVQLDGAPGCGKSSILPALLTLMCDKKICGKAFATGSDLIYTRCNTSYWDGYSFQKVVIFDEPFQGRGHSPDTSVALEFINLVSETPMRANMAAIHEKGINLTPELIGITSNDAYPRHNEINCNEAVWRRRNALVRVFLLEEDVHPGSAYPKNAYYILPPLRSTSVEYASVKDLCLSFEELVMFLGAQFRAWLSTAEIRMTRTFTQDQIRSMRTLTEEQTSRLALIAQRAGVPLPDFAFLREEDPPRRMGSEALLMPPVPSTHVSYDNFNPSASLYFNESLCCMATFELPKHIPSERTLVCANSLFACQNDSVLYLGESYDNLECVEQGIVTRILDQDWPVPFVHPSYLPFEERSDYRQMLRDNDTVAIWDINAAYKSSLTKPVECYRCEPFENTWTIPVSRDVTYLFKSTVAALEPEATTAFPTPNRLFVSDMDTVVDYPVMRTEALDFDSWSEWLTTKTYLTIEQVKELVTLLPRWALMLLAGLGITAAGYKLYSLVAPVKTETIWHDARATEFLDSVKPEYVAEMQYILSAKKAEIEEIERIVQSDLSLEEKRMKISEAAHYNNDMKRPHLARVHRSPGQVAIAKLQSQMAYDNAISKVTKVNRNILLLKVTYDDGKNYSTNALGVAGRFVLIPKHFANVVVRNRVRQIECSRSGIATQIVNVDSGLFRDIDELGDVMIMELPRTYPPFTNILNHFVSDEHLSLLHHFTAQRSYRDRSGEMMHHMLQARMVRNETYFDNLTDEPITICRGFRYEMSRMGSCGSPLYVVSNEQIGVICGLHVAGNGDLGLAELITQEMLRKVVPELTTPADQVERYRVVVEEPTADMKTQGVSECPVRNNVEYIGLAPEDCRSHSPTDTSFVASLVHGVFPVNHEPSVKSMRDDRISAEARLDLSPLYKSLNKYADPPIPFSAAHIKRAANLISSKIGKLEPLNGERRPLTMDETINGLGTKLPRMDLTTSPGVPYRYYAQPTQMRGKTSLFRQIGEDEHGPKYEIDETRVVKDFALGKFLIEQIDLKDAQLRQGIVPLYFATENLKDELVSLAKVRAAKTRTFEGLPLDILMLSRKYFGMWTMAMQQRCVDEPISVGITTPGPEWKHLYDRLNRFPNVVAGDYKAWDGKLMADVMYAAGEVINKWYSWNELDLAGNEARLALIQSWIHTYVCVGKHLVQTHQGLPSGVCVTAPLNSLCNWIYLICAILEEAEIQGIEISDQDILNNFEFAFYGDDHVVTVSHKFKHLFDFRKMKACMDRHGIGYTNSTKTEFADFDFEKLTDVTYLKRKFVQISNADVRAPLDLESIKKQMNWVRKRAGADPVSSLIEHYDSFCTELHQHGIKQYDDVIAIFNSAIRDVQQDHPIQAAGLSEITNDYDFYESRYLKSLGLECN